MEQVKVTLWFELVLIGGEGEIQPNPREFLKAQAHSFSLIDVNLVCEFHPIIAAITTNYTREHKTDKQKL